MISNVDTDVGRQIRARRTTLSLSQVQLAARAGIGWQQLYKYESGINRIAASRLYAVARALAVDVDFFFHGIGDEHSQPPPEHADTRIVTRMIQDLTNSFRHITNRQYQKALCRMVQVLTDHANTAVDGS